MNNLPPEILHSICALLHPKDVKSFRMLNRISSIVGAHYLLSEVTFYLGNESLERLRNISMHPILATTVTSLYYQSNVLEDIHLVKQYREHIASSGHVHHPRLEPLPQNASQRERRLYKRNDKKRLLGGSAHLTTRQVSKMMRDYAKICEDQRKAMASGFDKDILAAAVAQFPKLEEITFTGRPTCSHGYSERFMERFRPLLITPLTLRDTANSVKLLTHFLNPLAGTTIRLKSLTMTYMSPEILAGPNLKAGLAAVKDALVTVENLNISFKLDALSTDRLHDDGGDVCFKVLKSGGLPFVLSRMPALQMLCVAFDDCPCQTRINIHDIVGDRTWPDLAAVSLTSFSATDESLLNFLLRHVDTLRKTRFNNATVTKGSWVSIVEKMRSQLTLDDAVFHGILKNHNHTEMWDLTSVNVDSVASGEINTLSDDLNLWVCSGVDDMDMDDEDDDDLGWTCPLLDEDAYVAASEFGDGELMSSFDMGWV